MGHELGLMPTTCVKAQMKRGNTGRPKDEA